MRRIVTILMLMLLSACGTSLTQESAELKTPWGGIDAVGPDGRSGRYGVTALNSGDSSVFRPGTTVSALTLYAADPKTKKEVVAPYVIGRAQGATVNTPFGQGVDAFARVSAAALLGPIAALFSPDQGDTNIGGAQVGDVSATGTGGTAYAEQRLSAFLKMQNRFFTNLYGGKGGSVPCKEWGGKGGC
jgi:hypothetical protein